MKTSALILVCGLPGSGKSFFAQKLSIKTDALYLNSDILRKELFPTNRTYSEKEKQEVYDTLLERASHAIKTNKSVVVDATFYKNSLRIPFYTLAKQLNCPLTLFKIEADETLIRERTSKTRPDSEADFNVYLKLKNSFEPIEIPFCTLQSERNNIDTLLTEALNYLNHA
jgi:predicted kinase